MSLCSTDALALQAADLYMLSIPKVGVIYLERDGNTSLTSCIMPICHVCPVLGYLVYTIYTPLDVQTLLS